MILKDVIENVDAVKPNAFTNEQKTRWISEVEGRIQSEIFLFAPAQVIAYEWATDMNTELLAAPPHDRIYGEYLTAMIDFNNGEYNRYNNTVQVFNADFMEFMRWFAKHYRPADKIEDI